MKNYAIIENGIVENIIQADENFIAENELEAVEVTEATGVPYIKGTYSNGVFSEPVRVEIISDADPENGIPATPLG